MTYREFAENIKRQVRAIAATLEPGEDWAPVVFFERDGAVTVTPLPPAMLNSRTGKDALTAGLAMVCQIAGTRKLGMVTTVWVAAPNDEGKAPSESDDRREGVMVTVYDAERAEGHLAVIERREGEHPLLAPWDQLGDTVDGPMARPIIEALR